MNKNTMSNERIFAKTNICLIFEILKNYFGLFFIFFFMNLTIDLSAALEPSILNLNFLKNSILWF